MTNVSSTILLIEEQVINLSYLSNIGFGFYKWSSISFLTTLLICPLPCSPQLSVQSLRFIFPRIVKAEYIASVSLGKKNKDYKHRKLNYVAFCLTLDSLCMYTENICSLNTISKILSGNYSLNSVFVNIQNVKEDSVVQNRVLISIWCKKKLCHPDM